MSRASKYALAPLKPTSLLIPARLPSQAPQTPIPNASGPLQNSICHHIIHHPSLFVVGLGYASAHGISGRGTIVLDPPPHADDRRGGRRPVSRACERSSIRSPRIEQGDRGVGISIAVVRMMSLERYLLATLYMLVLEMHDGKRLLGETARTGRGCTQGPEDFLDENARRVVEVASEAGSGLRPWCWTGRGRLGGGAAA
ncbi:hypothetical protein FIBSPDRAFT_900860 [Athelia psychrophila]|uniref:Uncharacterized protein n=1 Tax=Athelia psychrophila TaxID=1759441 RepID=A0A165XX05_9AGAM|nr:hypothetical protein FIBSPDRAFT_900860 [Fibularhizoctonia sp. CBS 109695]